MNTHQGSNAKFGDEGEMRTDALSRAAEMLDEACLPALFSLDIVESELDSLLGNSSHLDEGLLSEADEYIADGPIFEKILAGVDEELLDRRINELHELSEEFDYRHRNLKVPGPEFRELLADTRKYLVYLFSNIQHEDAEFVAKPNFQFLQTKLSTPSLSDEILREGLEKQILVDCKFDMLVEAKSPDDVSMALTPGLINGNQWHSIPSEYGPTLMQVSFTLTSIPHRTMPVIPYTADEGNPKVLVTDFPSPEDDTEEFSDELVYEPSLVDYEEDSSGPLIEPNSEEPEFGPNIHVDQILVQPVFSPRLMETLLTALSQNLEDSKLGLPRRPNYFYYKLIASAAKHFNIDPTEISQEQEDHFARYEVDLREVHSSKSNPVERTFDLTFKDNNWVKDESVRIRVYRGLRREKTPEGCGIVICEPLPTSNKKEI